MQRWVVVLVGQPQVVPSGTYTLQSADRPKCAGYLSGTGCPSTYTSLVAAPQGPLQQWKLDYIPNSGEAARPAHCP